MAKDIDISLPDGGEITVPGWSTEETQKQIYTILKSMEGVDKNTVKKLEEAQRADDKNSQKQIEALKDISKDLQAANKMGFLGAMSAAASAAGTALGGIGKVAGVAAGAITTMGATLVAGATAATKFATAYTDALQPLVTSGVAFGDLGKQVNQSIVDLNRLGFSSEEAAQLINNSSTAFLRLGDTALADFTSNIRSAAEQGLKFGMAQDEATEYLATELEERARSGIIEKMNATQFAAMQYQVLEDQIDASRRLGKTVEEIADLQKDVMGDERLTAVLNSMSGDQQVMLKELAANLSTYGLSSGEIADVLAAEISGKGLEATEVGASLIGELAMIEGGFEGFRDSVKASMEGIRADDRVVYESATADLYKNQEYIGSTVGNAVTQGLKDGFNPMIIQMEATNTRILGMAGSLELSGRTGGEQGQRTDDQKEADTTVNQMAKTAKEFDNAILNVTGAFTAELTRAQQEINTTIGTMTKTINESGLVKGAQDLAQTLGNMAIDGIKAANEGLAGLAEDFVAFSQTLQQIYGEEGLGGVADHITKAAMDNIVMPLAKAIGSIFTDPAVIAAAVTGLGLLMATMRASVAGLPGVMPSGDPTDIVPGDEGDKDKDGKQKGKGGRFSGRMARSLVAGGAGAVLSGALELAELAGDIDEINKDLAEGKITRSEAQIAKSTETGEAVGGMSLAAGGAAAGAAAGSVIPIVGTAVGALIGGGIGWYLGRQGGRAMGEGLGEAVFTPEQEALEAELLKIEERLSGNLNRRTQAQLETRKKQVEAELALIKPIEQSKPVNPENVPIMTTYTREDEESGEDPETTAKKKQNEQDATDQPKTVDDLVTEAMRDLKLGIDAQNILLQKIAGNTGKTNSNLSAIADSQ